MLEDGWTNIRKGPGLNYRRVGKVTRPMVKKVFEVRLTKAVGRQPEGGVVPDQLQRQSGVGPEPTDHFLWSIRKDRSRLPPGMGAVLRLTDTRGLVIRASGKVAVCRFRKFA